MDQWLVHNEVPSPNWNERRSPVSMVVLHYTGMPTADEALERLTDPASQVSAHYLIDEAGKVTRLVPEDKRAWHAGRAYWRGIADVNSASVGIELVNPGHEWGYRPFPQAQMEALIPLLADIVKRHKIPYANVVGHSDVAPARKDDPGELFDWPLLARAGLALATPEPGLDPGWTDAGFAAALHRFGYDVGDVRAAVVAFQRRFRPRDFAGVVDAECRGLLFELLL